MSIKSSNIKIFVFFVVCAFFFALLAACGQAVSPTVAPEMLTPTIPAATPELIPSPTLEPSPTATAAPGLALILHPSGSAGPASQATLQGWQQAEGAAGLRWELRQGLVASELSPDLRLVVAYPGSISGSDIMGLAAAAPQVQFLSVGLEGVSPASNLTAAGPLRSDQQGFMAGLLAAMLTPDWRIAVISTSDSPAGLAARNGFLNGATLFCGLCNPYHGPIVDYPLYIELPVNSGSAEWQAAAQALLDKSVETVYLAPGVADPDMLALLAQNNVQLIGSYPMPPGMQAHWVASILPADSGLYQLLPGLLVGDSAGQVALPLDFFDIQEALSPGKERLARQYLADLLAGYIDTGVDPSTGEVR